MIRDSESYHFIMATPYIPPHIRNQQNTVMKQPSANQKKVTVDVKKSLTDSDFPVLSRIKKPHVPKSNRTNVIQPIIGSNKSKQTWTNVIQSVIEEDKKKEEELLKKKQLEEQKIAVVNAQQILYELETQRYKSQICVPHFRKHHEEDIVPNVTDVYPYDPYIDDFANENDDNMDIVTDD